MNRELSDRISIEQTIVPVVLTADADGVTVDTLGFESATMVLNAGIQAGTTPSHTFTLEDSDIVDSGFATVASADIAEYRVDGVSTAVIVIDASDEDVVIHKRGYIGGKRFLRVTAVVTGGGGETMPVSASIILGAARRNPV